MTTAPTRCPPRGLTLRLVAEYGISPARPSRRIYRGIYRGIGLLTDEDRGPAADHRQPPAPVHPS